MSFLAEKLELKNICVVVTRFKNGENIGAARFKYINEAFINGIELLK